MYWIDPPWARRLDNSYVSVISNDSSVNYWDDFYIDGLLTYILSRPMSDFECSWPPFDNFSQWCRLELSSQVAIELFLISPELLLHEVRAKSSSKLCTSWQSIPYHLNCTPQNHIALDCQRRLCRHYTLRLLGMVEFI